MKIQGILLVIIGLLLTSAFAVSHSSTSYNINAKCSKISIFTKNFYLGSNDSRTQNFIIKNNSKKTFFIENIQAFDESPYFFTKALKTSEKSIGAYNAIIIPVKVESFETARNVNEFAIFKVSGIFEDNSYCSSESIGISNFQVKIIAKEQTNASSFQLFFPETLKVSKEDTQFTISFTNPTENSGYLRIYSSDAIVNPEAIIIPSNSKNNAVITIKELDKNSTWIFYDIFLDSFKISKVTKVEKTQNSTPQNSQPLIQPSVSIDSKITPQNNGSYDLNITITNEKNFPISGSIEINIPNSWSIEGNTKVSLNAFESKTIQLKLKPEGFNEKDIQTTIEFKTNNGTIFSKPILLKANKPLLGIAFAVLGANAFLIGLIILIAIIILTIAYAASKEKQKAIVLKNAWAKSAK